METTFLLLRNIPNKIAAKATMSQIHQGRKAVAIMASGHEINVPSWSQLRKNDLMPRKQPKKLDPRQMTG